MYLQIRRESSGPEDGLGEKGSGLEVRVKRGKSTRTLRVVWVGPRVRYLGQEPGVRGEEPVDFRLLVLDF